MLNLILFLKLFYFIFCIRCNNNASFCMRIRATRRPRLYLRASWLYSSQSKALQMGACACMFMPYCIVGWMTLALADIYSIFFLSFFLCFSWNHFLISTTTTTKTTVCGVRLRWWWWWWWLWWRFIYLILNEMKSNEYKRGDHHHHHRVLSFQQLICFQFDNYNYYYVFSS